VKRPSVAVLGHREFRLYYAGQTISVLGDAMLGVALAFAVLDLTGSVSDLGFVLAAGSACLVVTILAGGVLADRFSRRWVMVAADLVRMATLGTAAVLLISGSAEVWQLVVLQGATGAAAGLFYPASTGLMPLTVPGEMLQPANGLRSVSQSAAQIAGPAIGGVLVVSLGSGWAIGVDALTFAVSAATLALLRLAPQEPAEPQHFFRDLADGWREFTAHQWVWVGVSVLAFGNVCIGLMDVLGPQIARQHLGGAGAWAAFGVAFGVGGLLGGAAVLSFKPHRPIATAGLLWTLVALPQFALALIAPRPVVILGAFAAGLGITTGNVLWETTLQRRIPPAALSRVSSYDWLGSLVLFPVGLAVAGPLSALLGIETTLLVSAVCIVGSGLLIAALPAVRAVRD
jgi:predicted MFS family arabinose efflux permease